jgi:hypothetical protein
MKKLTLILHICFVLALISINAKAQSTVFGTAHLFQVSFFDANKGVIVGATSGSAFTTPDGGNYWNNVANVLPNLWMQGLKLIKGTGNGIAVGQYRNIYKTENYGISWTRMIDEDSNIHFNAVDVREGVGLAVGRDGQIYRTTGLFNTTDIKEIETGTEIFVQNPVKDELRISNAANLKSVKIINLSGRIVCESNLSTIDVSRLPKGIYVVQVLTEEGKTVKKIIKE